MSILEFKYNNKFYPVNSVKIYQVGTYSGLPNLVGIAGSGEIAMNIIANGKKSGFAVCTTVSGSSCTIDWGDGFVETFSTPAYSTQNAANNLTAQVSHLYDINNSSGKGIWIEELKEYVYTIRIYNATSPIKYFKAARLTEQYSEQHNSMIEAYLNLSTLVDISQMFSNGISLTPLRCHNLKRVTITDCSNVLTSDYFAYECFNFENYNFPDMPVCTSRTYAFYNTIINNSTLNYLYSGASTANMSYFFAGSNLNKIRFLQSWGSVNNISYGLNNSNNLTICTLPNSIGNNKLTNCDYMFTNCYNLVQLNNVEYFGSTTGNTSMNGTFDYLESLEKPLVINAKLTKFSCKGSSTIKNAVTSIRLLNVNSTWSGTSPQADISYCTNMTASAINQFFVDLVASGNFSGKTVKVTGLAGYDSTIITNAGGIVAS